MNFLLTKKVLPILHFADFIVVVVVVVVIHCNGNFVVFVVA